MKLKRVDKDSWQKCCRWCKNFSGGECHANNSVGSNLSLQVYHIVEEGILDETLQETLMSAKLSEFKELENKLREWRISEKRIREFSVLFSECYEDWVHNEIRDMLSGSVDRCYTNHIESSGITISDPENYCCKEWC